MLRAFNIQTIPAGDGCCTAAACQCCPTAALVSLLREMLICRLAPALEMPLCQYGVVENAWQIYVGSIRRCRWMLSRMTIGSGARSSSCAMPLEQLIGCLVSGGSAGSKSAWAEGLPRAALLSLQKMFARRESLATRSSLRSRPPRCLR